MGDTIAFNMENRVDRITFFSLGRMIEFARFLIRRVFDFQWECSFKNEKKEMWNLVLYEINIVKRIGRILYDFAQLVWIVISIILFTKIYKMINSWIGELKNTVIIILDSLRFVFILIYFILVLFFFSHSIRTIIPILGFCLIFLSLSFLLLRLMRKWMLLKLLKYFSSLSFSKYLDDVISKSSIFRYSKEHFKSRIILMRYFVIT